MLWQRLLGKLLGALCEQLLRMLGKLWLLLAMLWQLLSSL